MIIWTLIVSTIFIFFIKSILETIAKEQLLKINKKEIDNKNKIN